MAKIVFTVLLLAIFAIISTLAAPSPIAGPVPQPIPGPAPQYYAYSGAYPYYSGYAYPYLGSGYAYYG